MPLSDIVCLDSDADRAVLTNTLSLERLVLEPGQWELVLNKEDDPVCYGISASGEQRIFEPDECFRKSIVRDATTGALWIVERDSGNKNLLEDESCKFRLAEVKFPVISSAAAFAFKVAVFRRPRAGNSLVYWSLNDTYKMLGLTCFHKLPSRWVWRCKDTWEKAARVTGCDGDHLIYSIDHADKEIKKNEMSAASRCLPFNAASTAALLLLTSRWASLPNQKGGFGDGDSARLARLLFKGLLRCLPADVDVGLDVFLVSGAYTSLWPRPDQAMGAHRVALTLRNGKLDLSPLVLCAEDGYLVAKRWWHQLSCGELVPTQQGFETRDVALV